MFLKHFRVTSQVNAQSSSLQEMCHLTARHQRLRGFLPGVSQSLVDGQPKVGLSLFKLSRRPATSALRRESPLRLIRPLTAANPFTKGRTGAPSRRCVRLNVEPSNRNGHLLVVNSFSRSTDRERSHGLDGDEAAFRRCISAEVGTARIWTAIG